MKNRLWMLNLCVMVVLWIAPPAAHAQCASEQVVAEAAARWVNKQPLQGFAPAMTMADAACTRDRFVEQLRANKQYGSGRVAVGGVASKPWRMAEAEAAKYSAAAANVPHAVHMRCRS